MYKPIGKMKVTEASANDIQALTALINNAYRGDTSRKGWTTEADLLDGIRIDETTLKQYFEDADSAILKSINEDRQITGCVYLKTKHDQMYLGMLTVMPELQANGIGKLLLHAAEERAKLIGCTSIIMTVISVRSELINWYERHGYYNTRQTEPFPQDEKFGIPKVSLEFVVLEKIL